MLCRYLGVLFVVLRSASLPDEIDDNHNHPLVYACFEGKQDAGIEQPGDGATLIGDEALLPSGRPGGTGGGAASLEGRAVGIDLVSAYLLFCFFAFASHVFVCSPIYLFAVHDARASLIRSRFCFFIVVLAPLLSSCVRELPCISLPRMMRCECLPATISLVSFSFVLCCGFCIACLGCFVCKSRCFSLPCVMIATP